MISLGKLLVKKSECTSAHLKTLLDGIASTAVETAGCTRTGLQRDLDRLSAEIDGSAPPDQCSPQMEQAVRLVDAHNRATEAAVAAQQKELRCMIAATTDTIADIGNASKDGVGHMRKLEESLENAANVEDLRLLRNRLFACLTLVRNESLRLQLESRKLTQSLKSAVLKASSQLVPGTDATTGLPGPDTVSQSVHEMLAQGESFSAAIFVLADLKSWNTRLGRQAGDEILQSASEFLQSQFGSETAMFRWNGPSFLVTCKGDERMTCDFVTKAWQIARNGFEFTAVLDGKMKAVPISFAWLVQRFSATENTEHVLRTLEECSDTLQNKH